MDSPKDRTTQRLQAMVENLRQAQKPRAQTNATPPTMESRVKALENKMQIRLMLELANQEDIQKLKSELALTMLGVGEVARDIQELRDTLDNLMGAMEKLMEMIESNPHFVEGKSLLV